MDNVNHPDHYALHYPLEVKDMIEIILINTYGPNAYKAYCLGNELKYRFRVGLKGSVEEEIGKAMKYMEFREEAAEESRDDLAFDDSETIEDGFGNAFSRWCPDCGAEMEIVRPGKVQCSKDCESDQLPTDTDILNDHSAAEETLRWRQGQPSLSDLVDWSEAPEWAKWAAQDKDGTLTYFNYLPKLDDEGDWAENWEGNDDSISYSLGVKELAQDWQTPLKRPDPKEELKRKPINEMGSPDSKRPSDMPL